MKTNKTVTVQEVRQMRPKWSPSSMAFLYEEIIRLGITHFQLPPTQPYPTGHAEVGSPVLIYVNPNDITYTPAAVPPRHAVSSRGRASYYKVIVAKEM